MAINSLYPAINFSFDLELGWGAINSSKWKERESQNIYNITRQRVAELLEFTSALGFKTTWGVVSSLLEINPTSPVLESHSNQLHSKYLDFINTSRFSTRNGEDIISLLQTSNLQEIISHSHTHVRFDNQSIPVSTYIQDLNKSFSLLSNLSSHNRTFGIIWPEDASPPSCILKQLPRIDVMRVSPYYNKKSLFKLLSKVINLQPSPFYQGSSLCIPGSFLVSWNPSSFSSYKKYIYRRNLHFFAFEKGIITHLNFWCHPFNLALSFDHFNEVKRCIHFASTMQEQNRAKINHFCDYLQ